MATAAFKSMTRRTSIGDSSSSSSTTHRRSRSVSRFSHRRPPEDEPQPPSNRRGKFVNTVRGSYGGAPEMISLDDLAIELFSSTDFCDTGRTTSSDVSSANNNNTTASHRRGRSVSRRGSRVGELRSFGDKNGVSDGSSRRRRSLSVVSRQVSDTQNEHLWKSRSHAKPLDLSVSNKQKPLMQKSTTSSQQRALRRCSSQKDFLRSHDGCSSYASTLTDDEGNYARYGTNGTENEIQAAYAQNKGPHPRSHDRSSRWHKAIEKEHIHTGKDIRPMHGQVMAKNDLSELASDGGLQLSDPHDLKAVSTVRSYRTKLEQSEKRKHELLAEIMLEEGRGKELKRIVGELLPSAKETTAVKRPMRGRKRSQDRNRTYKQLAEEADKIIEDFISSVEETDISSFDGERSDTSSVVGGTIKPMAQYGDVESFRSPLSDTKQRPVTPRIVLRDALEEATPGPVQEQSVNSKSSRGSWSPGAVNSFSVDTEEVSRAGEVNSSHKSELLSRVPRRKSQVDIDDYIKPPSNEDFLSERWQQRERINYGGLLICNCGSLGRFLL